MWPKPAPPPRETVPKEDPHEIREYDLLKKSRKSKIGVGIPKARGKIVHTYGTVPVSYGTVQ